MSSKTTWAITITPRAGGVRIRSVSPANAELVDKLTAKLERSVTEFLQEQFGRIQRRAA